MNTLFDVLLVVVGLSLLLCSIRLFKGPDVPDRAVAFDLVAAHAVGLFVLFAMRTDDANLVIGGLITMVLGFLGTVMLARFMEAAPFGQDSRRND